MVAPPGGADVDTRWRNATPNIADARWVPGKQANEIGCRSKAVLKVFDRVHGCVRKKSVAR